MRTASLDVIRVDDTRGRCAQHHRATPTWHARVVALARCSDVICDDKAGRLDVSAQVMPASAPRSLRVQNPPHE